MGARSSQPRSPNLNKTDGHLIEYFRNTFIEGGGGTNPKGLSGVTATGGNQSPTNGLEIDGYKYHFFTASATPGFAVSGVTGSGEIEYLVIAGGGGAGGYDGSYWDGGRGDNSVLTSPSSPQTVTAYGGGAGRYNGTASQPGGSGGGSPGGIGYGYNPSTPPGILSPIPLPHPYGQTQGFPSGANTHGGGGGAGQAGQPGNPPDHPNSIPTLGKGGDGKTAFDGANIPTSYGTTGPTPGRWFAGGGGSGGGTPFIEGPGGAGGGGHGICTPKSGQPEPSRTDPGAPTDVADTNGEQNTGGGGGGVGTLPPASTASGGGGAGGFMTGTLLVSPSPGAYPITIGGGGTGDSTKAVGGSGIVIIRYSV